MIVGQDLPMICAKEEVVSFRNNCITKNDDYDKPINQVIHNNTELIITKNDIHQFETFGDRITIGSDIIIEDISSNNTSVLLKPHAGKNWNIDNDVPLDCTKKDKANCDDEQIPITNVIPSIIYQQDKIISLNSTQQPIQQSVIDSVFDSDHAYPTQEATMIHGNESLDLQIGSQHVIQALQNGIGEQYCSNLTDENSQINQEEEQPVFADKVFNDQRYFIQPIFDPISGSNLVLNQCPVPTTQISLDGNEEHGLAWNQRGKKRKSMEDIDEDEDEGEDEDEVGVAEQSVSMNSPHSSRSMFTNDNQYTPYEEEKEEDDNEYHPPARRRRLNQDPDIDNDEEEYEDNNDNGNKRISRDGKKPRQMIPYEYKLKVLELKRKYPDISLQRLKELSGCSKFLRCNSQLRSWAKQLSHIKKECHIRGEINDYVYSRFINTQNSCGKITDDSVKAWCDEALKKIPCKTIKANDEWLESFKIDYKISKFLSGQLVIYPDTSNRENNTNNYLQLNHSNEYDGNEDDNDDNDDNDENDENDDDADDADDDAMDTEHEKIHVNSIDNQNVIIAEENHNVDMEIDDNNEKIIENDNDINIGDKTNDNYNINNHIEDNENITTSAVELYNPINNKKTKKSYKKIKNNKKVEMSRSKRVVLTDEEKIVIIKIHYKNPTWTLSQLREATFSRLKGASQIKHWEHVLRTKGAFNDDMINTNNNNDTITLQKLIEVNGRQRRDKMVKTGIKKRNDNNNKQIKINNKKKQLKIRKFSKKKTNDKQIKLNKKQRGESHLRIANKKRNFRKDIILRTTRNGDKYKLTADDNKQNLNNNTNINIINNNNNNINNNNSNKVKKNSKKTVRFDINKDDNTDENIKNLVDNWVYAKCIELKNENRKLRNNILTKWAIIANDKFNEGGDYGGDKPWREAFKKKYNLTGAYDNLQLGNENLLQVTDETNENNENNDNDIDDNGNINDNVDDYDNNEDDDNEHEANNDDEDDDEAEDEEEEEDDDVNDNDDDGDDDDNDDNDDDNNEDEDEEEDDTVRNDDEDNFNHDHHNISPTMKSDDQDDYTPESLKNILNLNDSKVKIVSVEKMVGPTISGAIYNPANGQIKWRLDTP
ncbi:protein PFC0760c-like [Aphidius gifuensis]|uniref:protein PFC0760c-like n=1 Tax=Aphidius gifuensis TaxID=684658 RepID=UPI001CDD3F56|nr:protein PFC0760c-like [Aphidius gifuensis]